MTERLCDCPARVLDRNLVHTICQACGGVLGPFDERDEKTLAGVEADREVVDRFRQHNEIRRRVAADLPVDPDLGNHGVVKNK